MVKDGLACLSVDGNERLKFTFVTAQSVVYLACWFRFNYDPLTAQIVLRVGNATTDANLRLQLGTDRKLSILDAVGVVSGTSTAAYAKDTWHFLELRIVHSCPFGKAVSASLPKFGRPGRAAQRQVFGGGSLGRCGAGRRPGRGRRIEQDV